MVKKTVMSVNMECYKCKRMAFRSLTEIDGIDSIEFNMKEKTMTVVGDADPVCMTNQIRRKFNCARLISHGPPPPPPKKKDDSKEKPAPNPSNPSSKSHDVIPIISYPPYPIPTAYSAPPHCCCGWSPCSCRSGIDVYVVNEEPPACTVC